MDDRLRHLAAQMKQESNATASREKRDALAPYREVIGALNELRKEIDPLVKRFLLDARNAGIRRKRWYRPKQRAFGIESRSSEFYWRGGNEKLSVSLRDFTMEIHADGHWRIEGGSPGNRGFLGSTPEDPEKVYARHRHEGYDLKSYRHEYEKCDEFRHMAELLVAQAYNEYLPDYR